MKKTIYSVTFALAVMALPLTSCVKDDLYGTPHPDHGRITVTTDWTERTEGVAVPEAYTVRIGDYTAAASGTVHEADRLFEPGDYRIDVYNAADHITVDGTTATLATAGRGLVVNAPGWLFTGTQPASITKDCDHTVAVAMVQQVRRLTLVIEPKGESVSRIEHIGGTLDGVAGSLDFVSGVHGAASATEVVFRKITEGSYAGKWGVTLYLLGTAGDSQRLSCTIRFKDGSPLPQSLESDLTAALAGFNGEKKTPLTLDGIIEDSPEAADVSATIEDWAVADDEIIIH